MLRKTLRQVNAVRLCAGMALGFCIQGAVPGNAERRDRPALRPAPAPAGAKSHFLKKVLATDAVFV